MSKPQPTRYRTTNWSSYDAALKKCGSLTVWFDPSLKWAGLPTGRCGRQQSYSDAAIQACLTLKVLFGFALRQTTGFVESLLCLLIDSTGIKGEGEGEWHRRQHGGSKRRIWRKLHISVDEGPLEIRAVEMTGNEIGDAPVLPMLLKQIPQDEDIANVTADGAYDTRRSHDTIAARGAREVLSEHPAQ